MTYKCLLWQLVWLVGLNIYWGNIICTVCWVDCNVRSSLAVPCAILRAGKLPVVKNCARRLCNSLVWHASRTNGDTPWEMKWWAFMGSSWWTHVSVSDMLTMELRFFMSVSIDQYTEKWCQYMSNSHYNRLTHVSKLTMLDQVESFPISSLCTW